MSGKRAKTPQTTQSQVVSKNVTFLRFTLPQRWEHAILLISIFVLLLTGLPQKYLEFPLSQDLLSTPERVELIQLIHHIAAIVLAFEVVYHLCRIIYMMAKRRLPGDLLPVWQDVRDAGHMVQYLLFLRKDKPKFGRYNFEQKVTYWFVFFGPAYYRTAGEAVAQLVARLARLEQELAEAYRRWEELESERG